jgi:hypothetical protein
MTTPDYAVPIARDDDKERIAQIDRLLDELRRNLDNHDQLAVNVRIRATQELIDALRAIEHSRGLRRAAL